ncbi:MAG: hypothetical protein O3A93_05075 [Chloroflexi bacterium]|nr:hypothetical protein [Chloroflexota bacterium]MDA1270614.1 hypothetical protein [Chloroflexota bacterium]
MPTPDRDWLDWLVALFTVSSGLVLAFAAVFAYAVQRARYLRDIAPDLRLAEIPNFPALISDVPNWIVRYELQNVSADANAEDVYVRFNLRYGVGHSADLEFGLGRLFAGSPLNFSTHFSSRNVMLAIHEVPHPMPSGALTINVSYSTPRELVLFLLHPLGMGRKRYVLNFEVRWHWYRQDSEANDAWIVGDAEMIIL